jgi:serine/threonine-protein kinase
VTIQPGTRLGPYEIVALIGRGGMGEVYRARDTRLGREVAVKILPPNLVADRDRAERFEDEARATAALNHPNIVAIYDVGQHDGTPFLITELLEGRTLRQKLVDGPLPLDTSLRYARQIADALAAAHARNIVHRDVKPENIFVLPDDRIKVLDFGLARHLIVDAGAEVRTTFDGGGHVVGTPGYMAPEQIRGQVADARADVFAFGAVLYEMLAGLPAFAGRTLFARMEATISGDPRDLSALEASVPAGLASVLQRCLAKLPEARIQRMAEVAVLLGVADRPATTTRAPLQPTIAVLPFADISPGKDNDYFCDGVCEEILDALAKVSGLRVASRTSSFQFKGSATDATTIAKQLNVKTVLEGSVRRARERLRIAVRLVDADTGHQLWAEMFDRTMDDVFAVQEEIAKTVVAALRVTLNAPAVLVRDRPADVAAYTLYLRGRHHWNRRTEEGLTLSIEYYRQALERDPRYAQAYAGLAEAHVSRGLYGLAPADEAMNSARQAAGQALAISPDSGPALAVMATVQSMYDWAWSDGEATFKRAITADPQYATSYPWYALHNLVPRGRFREAAGEIDRALQIDPLSLVFNTSEGIRAYYAGDLDAASVALSRTVELDPSFALAHLFRGFVYVEQRRNTDAVEELQRSVDLSGGSPETHAALGYAFARADRVAEAIQVLEWLRAQARARYVSPVLIATVLSGLGEFDAALDALDQAADRRAIDLVWIKVRPVYRRLADHPRFIALTARMGLST